MRASHEEDDVDNEQAALARDADAAEQLPGRATSRNGGARTALADGAFSFAARLVVTDRKVRTNMLIRTAHLETIDQESRAVGTTRFPPKILVTADPESILLNG